MSVSLCKDKTFLTYDALYLKFKCGVRLLVSLVHNGAVAALYVTEHLYVVVTRVNMTTYRPSYTFRAEYIGKYGVAKVRTALFALLQYYALRTNLCWAVGE